MKMYVYKDIAGEWRWRIVHKNGEIVCVSGEAFASKSNATKAAKSLASKFKIKIQVVIQE